MRETQEKSFMYAFIWVLIGLLIGVVQFPLLLFASPITNGQPPVPFSHIESNQEIIKPKVNKFRSMSGAALAVPINQTHKSAVQTQATSPKSYYLCRSRGEVRTLRLVKKNEGICFINYTKQGVDEKVGESKSLSTCITVIDNIKSNLESATWKCKNISSSQITEPKSN